jgi:fibronectin-binding autotransporter adhesin
MRPISVAAFALALSAASSAFATNSVWIFTQAVGQGWFDALPVGDDGNGHTIFTNNWGQTSTAPTYPGSADSVDLGTFHTVILDTPYFNSGALNQANSQATIGTGTLFKILDGTNYSLTGGTLTNNGTVQIGYGGWFGNATLTAGAPLSLSGNGDIAFTGGNIAGSAVVTVASTITLHGYQGYISAPLANYGTINADAANNIISLLGSAKDNYGLMKSSASGSSLELRADIVQHGAAQILADTGIVNLISATVTGGTLATVNNGLIFSDNCTATLVDVSNTGHVLAENHAQLHVAGSQITNTGILEIGGYTGGAGWASLVLDSNLTFAGTGAIVLAPGTIADSGSFALTNAAGHTIHGGGSSNISVALINDGLVSADRVNEALFLNAQPKFNHNIMNATNGGALYIASNVNQTPSAQILADNGTVTPYNSATITGGILASANGGRFFTDNAVFTLTDVTNNATWLIQNHSQASLAGASFTNNATFEVGGYTGGAGWASLVIASNLTLAGTGDVLLNPGTLTDSGPFTLTIAATQKIHGGGSSTISVAFNNLGTVDANRVNEVLILNGNPKSNSGTLRASSGGHLYIATNITQAPTGQIVADAAEVNPYNGANITGGTLKSLNAGRFAIGGGGAQVVLTDVTNQAKWLAENGSEIRLAGSTLTNSATIELGGYTGGSGWARLTIASNVTLSGTGDILLNPGYFANTGAYTLTNSAGHTLHGTGTIQGGLTLNNLGTVEALGGTLDVQCAVSQYSGTTLTAGTWKATNATLNIGALGNVVTNQATVILNGSSATFTPINALADNQGTFTVRGGKAFTTAGALSNEGMVYVGSASVLNVTGAYTPQPGSTTWIDGQLNVANDITLTGMLCGTGNLSAHVTITFGTALSPGNSPGTLTVSSLTLQDGAAYVWETSPTASDLVDVQNILDCGPGKLHVTVSLLDGAPLPSSITLFHFGSLAQTPDASQFLLDNNLTFRSLDTSNNNLTLLGVSTAAIPEPATLGLLVLGGLALLRRRR